MKRFRIFISSPSDIVEERHLCVRTMTDLACLAADRDLQLELNRWEDVPPGLHPLGAQGLIESEMNPGDADILVGIFWKRFGTPTHDAASGTEREIRLGLARWEKTDRPHIMVYYRSASFTRPTDEERDQYHRLSEFRKEIEKQGRVYDYGTPIEFERSVRLHLTKEIMKLPAAQREELSKDEVLARFRELRNRIAQALRSSWSKREWTGTELQTAQECYGELRTEALGALRSAGQDLELRKRNALALILHEGKLEDVIEVLRSWPEWPSTLPHLATRGVTHLETLARDHESVLIGSYRLLARAGKSEAVVSAIEGLKRMNTFPVAVSIAEELRSLRGLPYGEAVMALKECGMSELLFQRYDVLERLVEALRGDEYFDASLDVIKHIDGDRGREVLAGLVSELGRSGRRDVRAIEMMSALAATLGKMSVAPITEVKDEGDEGEFEAPYTPLDGE